MPGHRIKGKRGREGHYPGAGHRIKGKRGREGHYPGAGHRIKGKRGRKELPEAADSTFKEDLRHNGEQYNFGQS